MTTKLSARGKLLSGLKKSGYDATERQNYWKAEQEKLKAEHEKLTKEIEARRMKEDAPVNNVGGGNVAGLGIGPQGEPGVNLRNKKKVIPFSIFTRKMSNK